MESATHGKRPRTNLAARLFVGGLHTDVGELGTVRAVFSTVIVVIDNEFVYKDYFQGFKLHTNSSSAKM